MVALSLQFSHSERRFRIPSHNRHHTSQLIVVLIRRAHQSLSTKHWTA